MLKRDDEGLERLGMDSYALLEDTRDSRTRISQRVTMDSQRAHSIGLSQAVHHELQTHRDHVYAHETQIQAHQTQLQLQGTLIQTQHQVHETRSQMQQEEMAELQETNHKYKGHTVEILRVMRDMRREMSDMQAELLALRGQQRARQPGPDARIPDDQDTSRDADIYIYALDFYADFNEMSTFELPGTEVVVWFKLGATLTMWNGQIRTLGPDAYSMTWEVLKKKMSGPSIVHWVKSKADIELYGILKGQRE
ncbi:hypothetical protein Tco_0830074 [Tanacetum coccineum]